MVNNQIIKKNYFNFHIDVINKVLVVKRNVENTNMFSIDHFVIDFFLICIGKKLIKNLIIYDYLLINEEIGKNL